jgi:hypothetical protein
MFSHLLSPPTTEPRTVGVAGGVVLGVLEGATLGEL